MMKLFLTLTAIIEGLTGISLLLFPTLVSTLLLNIPDMEPSGIIVGRVAGAALISLTLDCWYSRKRLSLTGIKSALLFYNFSVAFILIYGSFCFHFNGIALWPAIVLHFVFGLWSLKLIFENRST